MCSPNESEVESVRNELARAGIVSETRLNPVAQILGVNGVELWVPDERDFSEASKLFARMQHRTSARAAQPASTPSAEGHNGQVRVEEGSDRTHRLTPGEEYRAESQQAGEPSHEELRQAGALLARGIEAIIRRENDVADEGALWRRKAEELSQRLAETQAALAREQEARTTAEREQADQISSLQSALEREQTESRQQVKSRDELLDKTRTRLEAVSQLFESQQSAAAALREENVMVRLQRDELEKALAESQAEARAERSARLAAEQRAQQAAQALQSLAEQLLHHKELEQQMQAHVASLTSLCGRMDPKGNAGSGASNH